jgi:hypothetical protein
VINPDQTPSLLDVQDAGLKDRATRGRMESVMHSSQRYRRNAEVCLKAAYAGGSHYQNLNLYMAQAWLKLAGHQEAIDRLLTKGVASCDRFGVAP